MAKKQYMKGGALMVAYAQTGGTESVIDLSISCKIDETATFVDPETKDDSKYQQVDPEGNKWTVQCDFQVDENMANYKTLFNLKKNHSVCSLTIGSPAGNVDEGLPEDGWTLGDYPFLEGSAYITSLSMNAPKGNKVTASVTFSGKSKLSYLTE